MLILSRRPNESICFPSLGISISIFGVQGTRVRIGVDAPEDVNILRGELNKLENPTSTRTTSARSPAKGLSHELRNSLNVATLGLHLAQKQMEAGQLELAEKSLAQALEKLSSLEREATLLSSQEEMQVSEPKGTYSVPGRSRDQKNGLEVLLVEDDPNEQALLRSLLEYEGYTVQTASNGNEAMDRLTESRPHFILLDMSMPECDGRETISMIRQQATLQRLPVYAVSGSSPNSMGVEIGSGGVDEWFPKPLNAGQLLEHLRSSQTLCVSTVA